MNRVEFQQIAERRLEDARLLLENQAFGGAYYMVGYVVECALKASIAKKTERHDFPDRNAHRFYTHNLAELLNYSGLAPEMRKAAPDVEVNWAIVAKWSEQSRYQDWLAEDARTLYEAVAEPTNGVLVWIKQYW